MLGGVVLSAFALMGCSDDEKYDVDGSSDNIVYVNPSVSPTFKATIMRTHVGSFGYVGASVPVNIQRAASGNVQVSLTPDTSLVSEYNKQNNTECKAFPASVLSKLTVDAGSFSGGATTDTVTISAGDDTFGQFTESSYVLPLRLTTQGGDNVRPSTNHGVAYLVVNTTDVTDFVKLDRNKVDCNVVKTPAGTFGGIDATFKVSLACPVSADWTSNVTVDNSLIADYNSKNGTSYEALSNDLISQLTITPQVIAQGETTSETGIRISAPVEKLASLSGSYLIPLRVTSTYKDQTVAEDGDIVYITLGVKESLINDDANAITGTKAASHDGWSVSDCTNLNPDNFADLFGSGWGAGWKFNEKGSTAGFTLDLGKERSLAGFYLEGYVMKNCLVEVSTDKTNWVTVGNTSEHQAYSKYDYETWESQSEYVFYGSVKCRYIRFKFDLDADSWAWSYYNKVQGFSLYFND